MIALGVVHPDFAQHFENGFVLDELRDRDQPHGMADGIDRLHHCPIGRVGGDIAHEGAIDLEVIDRQILEVGKRRQPAAEIIERKSAAQLLHLADEAHHPRQIGHRRTLGDLEAQCTGR